MNLDNLNKRDTTEWMHPETADIAVGDVATGAIVKFYDPSTPFEARRDAAVGTIKAKLAALGIGDTLPGATRHTVPGCPEEPDTQGVLSVFRPEGDRGRNMRCIILLTGGGLALCGDYALPGKQIADKYNAVVVMPKYRTYFENDGKYPGTVNDVHAAYIWVVENAKDLGISKKKILMMGLSSGSHLALAVCHRLKRYDYHGTKPCGVIAVVPVIDNRTCYPSSKRIQSWGGAETAVSSAAWLGYGNMLEANVPAEAFANNATVEECVGLPPTFIHTGDIEVGVDPDMQYVSKLIQAGVYTDLHVWGGMAHATVGMAVYNANDASEPYIKLVNQVAEKQIEDCFTYDLSRPFVKELLEV